jgi:hypothetical protein
MNPELQRNLWLEASPRRLAWAGVTVLLIYVGVAIIDGQNGSTDLLGALGSAGAFVFFAAALVWGVRLAGQSVSSEIGERTWEFQRLSALDPWTMTWGKLFGATSLAWAAGLSGLLLAGLAYANVEGPGAALTFVVAGAALAVLLQSAGFAAALVGVRKARAEGRLATLRSAAGGAFSVLFLLAAIAAVSQVSNIFVVDSFGLTPSEDGALVRFWGAELDRRGFAAVSLVCFAGWSLGAAWRLMRLELQKRNGPLFWIGFLLFTAFWAAGQVTSDVMGDPSNDATAFARWCVAAAVFAAGVYAAAFAEPADRLRLRRFRDGLRSRGAWLTHTPAVVPALLLTAIAAVGVISQVFDLGDFGPEEETGPLDAALFVLAILAFILRDVSVIAFFRFGPRPKRGDFGAVLALALLYGLGGLVAASFGGDAVSVILPSIEQPVISLVSGLLQAAVAAVLAYRRVRGVQGTTVPA